MTGTPPTHGAITLGPDNTLHLTGEIDGPIVHNQAADIAVETIGVIDVTGLTFIDSAGLSLIARVITSRLRDHPIEIHGQSPLPALLDVIGLEGTYRVV